jgi:hypothetical protein
MPLHARTHRHKAPRFVTVPCPKKLSVDACAAHTLTRTGLVQHAFVFWGRVYALESVFRSMASIESRVVVFLFRSTKTLFQAPFRAPRPLGRKHVHFWQMNLSTQESKKMTQ